MSKNNLMKHITRYTTGNCTFNGYRVTMTCGSYVFVHYFTDIRCGGEQQAKEAALGLREQIYDKFHELEENCKGSQKELKKLKAAYLDELKNSLAYKKDDNEK